MALRTPEQLLAGRYRTIRRLGSGGMATVFLAEDERLGRPVAVKRLHGGLADDDLVKRFRREARLGASLNHPNVVAVYDIASDDEGVLIVMEYVEGQTLRDAIAAGPLPPERALPILRGVAEALDHAHGLGVLHRDVKPANVLLRHDGAVKLADLGIATAAEHSRITRSGSVLGTASYMAPERLEGGSSDRAADVYALAAVAFEALSGRRAIEGNTPLEVAQRVVSGPAPDLVAALPGAPPAAAEVLRGGLAKDPAARPASAGELVSDLVRVFAAAPQAPPTAAMRVGPRASVLPSGRIATKSQDSDGNWRRPIVFAAIAAGLLAALLIALSVGGGSDRSGTTKPTAATKKKHHAKASSKPAAPVQSQPTQTPQATVNDFYQRAAQHDYQGAWSLLTPSGQRQLGGYDSFARSQSTLQSISFPTLRTTQQTSGAATVELRSNAVHSNRTDHVCGSVDLVRSGSGWLLNAFHLNTCPGTSSGPPPTIDKHGRKRGHFPKSPRPSQAHGQKGAEGGD
jgi:serine/threonine protein kinase